MTFCPQPQKMYFPQLVKVGNFLKKFCWKKCDRIGKNRSDRTYFSLDAHLYYRIILPCWCLVFLYTGRAEYWKYCRVFYSDFWQPVSIFVILDTRKLKFRISILKLFIANLLSFNKIVIKNNISNFFLALSRDEKVAGLKMSKI